MLVAIERTGSYEMWPQVLQRTAERMPGGVFTKVICQLGHRQPRKYGRNDQTIYNLDRPII